MSYSSYQNQQDMANRITRLEIMLGLLIQNTQGPVNRVETRELLLNFAGVVDKEQDIEAALEPKEEAT